MNDKELSGFINLLNPHKDISDNIIEFDKIYQDFKRKYGEKSKSNLDEEIDTFFEKLDGLSIGDKTKLSRSLGVRNFSNAEQLIVIYGKTGISHKNERTRWIWVLCACIYCYMNRENGKSSFAKILKEVLISDSSVSQFENFISNFTLNEQRFAVYLSSMIHRIKSQGYNFDCKRLLKDILCWENSKHFVQIQWMEDFYNNNKEKES